MNLTQPLAAPEHGLSRLRAVLWLAAAATSGLLIATSPPVAVAVALVVIAVLLLAMITPLSAVIVLAILAPIRTLIATEAPLPLPLDIGQIALIGLLVAYIGARVARQQRLLPALLSPLQVILLIFIVVTGLTAFQSLSLTAWLSEWLKWVQVFVLVWIIRDLGQPTAWEWIIFGLVVASLANGVIGIYQYFGGSGALHLVVNERFFRAFGTFGQPNPFGGFMGLTLPLTAAVASGYIRLSRQQSPCCRNITAVKGIFYSLAVPVQMTALVMSWSRGAWIGAAAAAAVCAFALPRRLQQSLLALTCVIILVAAAWLLNLIPTSITERIASSTQEFLAFEDMRGVDITPENYAIVERLAHWQAALRMAEHAPWLGIGFGNFDHVYTQFRLSNWPESLGHAHNYYLNLWAESGIIGLLVYCKVWIIILITTWRVRRHPDPLARFTAVGLLGSWTYLTVHHLFDNLYVNNLFLHLGLMLGVLEVLYGQTQCDLKLDGL